MPKITRTALTKRTVETAATSANLYRLRDNNPVGLVLRVAPTGAKTWAISWGRGQERVFGRFPVMTLEYAREEAKRLLADPQSRARTEKVETLATFLDERYGPWVTVERKAGKATLANIKAQFADFLARPLTAITPWSVEKFKSDRLRAGINPATVNRDLGRIKAMLAKAVEWGSLPDHPLRTVKPAKGADNSRVRFLSTTEESALRSALAKRDDVYRVRRVSGNEWRAARRRAALPAIAEYADHVTPMTLLALNTGMRRGELTSITWADIRLPAKMLTVRAGYAKSGKARHIPLNSEAVVVLKAWKEQHGDSGRLFPVESVKKAWAALLDSAGIHDFKFHDCRHTFASKLVMAGVDLNTVRELLGHAKIEMTLRYAHLAPEHKAAAVEKLNP